MASTTTVNLEQNSSVLLLGASGQLGRILRHFWQEPPLLCSQSRQSRSEFIKFDLILEPKKAVQAMRGKSAVVCLSGVTPAQVMTQGEVYSRNSDLALAAVQAAADAGVPRVFLASSAAVYGKAAGVQNEAVEPKPASEYGHAKLAMEQSAIALGRQLGQPITNLRIGNVAGADAILGGWHDDMQIDVLADGTTPKRSYIGPQTLTRIIGALCQTADLPEVLNIVAPGAVEMGALLDGANLAWSKRAAPQGVIPRVELCTKLLEDYTSFDPQDRTISGMIAQWRALQHHDKE